MKLSFSVALAALLASTSVDAYGMNCRGSKHCKHSNPGTAGLLAGATREIADDAIIPYDRLIACSDNICMLLNAPKENFGVEGVSQEGVSGAQVKRMARYIVAEHNCNVCGIMAFVYPENKKNFVFTSGSLEFDYRDERWQRQGCGLDVNGLCDWVVGDYLNSTRVNDNWSRPNNEPNDCKLSRRGCPGDRPCPPAPQPPQDPYQRPEYPGQPDEYQRPDEYRRPDDDPYRQPDGPYRPQDPYPRPDYYRRPDEYRQPEDPYQQPDNLNPDSEEAERPDDREESGQWETSEFGEESEEDEMQL